MYHPEQELEDEYDTSYYNPECVEEQYEYYEQYEHSQQVLFSCETCDRDFYSKSFYDRHMSEHRVCNLDGCQFTAHQKVVEKHVLMQHATGLYDKIRNINTPEDIVKWVEERKLRYPSKENILKRQERQDEMLKRGARIKKNENRFGNDKFRFTKCDTRKAVPKKKPPKRPFVKQTKPVSLINEKIDWNGTMFPFKGTSSLENDLEKEASDFEDEEWSNVPSKPAAIKLNNALGALMGAYMSGSETDDETQTETKVEMTKVAKIEMTKDIAKMEMTKEIADVDVNKEVSKETEIRNTNVHGESQSGSAKVEEDSDGEPPTEVKIQREKIEETPVQNENKTPQNNSRPTRSAKKRKRQFNKPKQIFFKNRFGKFIRKNIRPTVQTSVNKKNGLPYDFRKRKVTLLEKLLAGEIRQERNILLQCIRYTVENNFFMKNPSTSY